MQPEAPCHEHSLEDWVQALSVNLTSYFLFSKLCLPDMLAEGEGVIVNLASVQGLQSQPGILCGE
jgi:NAD(P)-dependent dehydrogenase (short-subunit alcohol dehydrogenase family)